MEKLNVYKEIEFDGPVINNEMGKVFFNFKYFLKASMYKNC